MTISVLQTFPKRGRFFGEDIDPFTGSKPQKETLMSSCNTNNQQDNTKNSGSLPGDLAREVELVAVNQLVPYGGNARTHSKKQVRQIANSINRFGFTNPVLIDDQNGIIAGHARVEAAKLLGLTGIPALRLSHLSTSQSDIGKRTQEKSPLWRRMANHLRRSKMSGPDLWSLLVEND